MKLVSILLISVFSIAIQAAEDPGSQPQPLTKDQAVEFVGPIRASITKLHEQLAGDQEHLRHITEVSAESEKKYNETNERRRLDHQRLYQGLGSAIGIGAGVIVHSLWGFQLENDMVRSLLVYGGGVFLGYKLGTWGSRLSNSRFQIVLDPNGEEVLKRFQNEIEQRFSNYRKTVETMKARFSEDSLDLASLQELRRQIQDFREQELLDLSPLFLKFQSEMKAAVTNPTQELRYSNRMELANFTAIVDFSKLRFDLLQSIDRILSKRFQLEEGPAPCKPQIRKLVRPDFNPPR